jgi:hypothetical protein
MTHSTIKLNRNKVAIVDSEYHERLNHFHWECEYMNRHLYAYRAMYVKGSFLPCYIYMHRLVMELAGFDVDGFTIKHINKDTLDNRIENLKLEEN